MLQNASDFPALDQIYRQQFKGDPPARTTIIGNMVRPGALLEIQVTAVPNGVPRKAILPAGWMKPTSPYSYAIHAGDTLYLSGLVSRNGEGQHAGAGRHRGAGEDDHGQRRPDSSGRRHVVRGRGDRARGAT